MSDKPELRHGSEWADHEDCIVGNLVGLAKLRDACDVAIQDGEYFGNDLGEFVGIKRLDSAWFKQPQDAKSTRLANYALSAALLGSLTLMIIGVVTVIGWAI